jgi:hypothetical protein
VLVISSVEWTEYNETWTWHWHLSISCSGRRAPDDVVRKVLRQFDLPNAEEDNHQPGIARNFWRVCSLPADALQVACDCKEKEEVVVEPDGFTWTRIREGAR